MNVQIIYNPYKTDTKILINNRPIADYSKLNEYSNVGFHAWCLQILDDIFEETNRENFNLIITSTPYFSKLLKQIAEHFDGCKEIFILKPIIELTLQERLKTIVDYLGIEEFTQVFSKIYINYFTYGNAYDEELYDLLRNEVKLNLNFMSSNEEYLTYSKLKLSDITHINQRELDDSIYIFDINDKEHLISILKYFHNTSSEYNHLIFLYPQSIDVKELELISVKDFGRFGIEFISKNEHIKTIIITVFNVLQQSVLIKKLNKLAISKDIDHSKEMSIKLVNRIDPILSTPKHIILNTQETYKIDPFIYPRYPNIQVEYSVNNTNIKISSNIATAYDKGIARITVYLKNNPYVFDVIDVEVNQQILVEKIEFLKHEMILGINDKIKLDINYFPKNAQNIHQIKYISKNPEIASIDDSGFLVANNPGKCNIIAVVNNVVCSCCVEVKNRVQKICLSDQHLCLKMGQTQDLGIEIYPKDAINNEIELVSLNNVVNVLGYKVKASQIGEDELIVRTKDNTVSTTCKIIVESTLNIKETHHLTVSAILITVFNLVLQNIFVSILAIVVSYLCARKQKSDTGLAIIISLINIILLFF